MSEDKKSTVGNLPEESSEKVKKKAVQFHKKLDDISRTIDNEGVLQTTQKSGDDIKFSFPAKYVGSDPDEDTKQIAKIEYLKRFSADDVPILKTVTDEDAKWLMDKELQRTRYIFDNWFGTLFDLEDINKLRTAQELYPEYFKMRESEIMKQAELQKRLALMKLYGPRTLEDLQFLYVYLQGDSGIRNVPLHRLDKRDGDPAERYWRGVFSPSRFFRLETISHKPQGFSLRTLVDNVDPTAVNKLNRKILQQNRPLLEDPQFQHGDRYQRKTLGA
jgi:hypothetical protein